MCGISGFYNIKNQKVSEDLLDTFNRIQHHRGPDAYGKFYENHIGFAHNRLSLLDLSESGNQPFVMDDFTDILGTNRALLNYIKRNKGKFLQLEIWERLLVFNEEMLQIKDLVVRNLFFKA